MPGCASVRVNHSFAARVLAGVLIWAWLLLFGAAAETKPAVTPIDLAQFYLSPSEEATLRWTVSSEVTGDQLAYEITDYGGRPVLKAEAAVAADRILSLVLTLPQGWYELKFPALGATFGLVVNPAQARPLDPFFCLDSAMSWLETRAEVRPALVRVLKRSGVALVRERLSWGRINPAKDVWDWDLAPRQHDTLRQLYRAEGVPLLEMWGGGAPRVPHLGDNPKSPYPRNYPEVLRSWQTIAARYSAGWGAEETWNEPELTGLPADSFVSFAKVVAYTTQQAGLTIPTGGGALATIPPGPFFDAAAANGFLRQIDYVSFHTYDSPRAVETLVTRYRAWLKAAGEASLPIWITESGAPWTYGPSRPPAAEDARSALDIVMKAVEFRAGGVARYFPFVYTYYREGARNFGMLGAEATPLRAMGAYVNAIRTLSGHRYAGDLAGLPPSVVAARWFAPSERNAPWVLALFVDRVGGDANVRLPFAPLRVEGIDGRALPAVADVTVADGLTYVWADAAVAQRLLQTDTPMQRLAAFADKPRAPRSPASPVVLQFLFDQTPAKTSHRGYWVEEAVARALPLTIRVTNLAAEDRDITVDVQLPGEKVANPDRRRVLQVPAGSFVDHTWMVDAAATLDLAEPRMIRVEATTVEASSRDTLALPFGKQGTLEQHLDRHAVKQRMPIGDLTRWKPAVAPEGRMNLSVTGEIFRADAVLKYEGGWMFPRFFLPERIFSERTAGILVRARILKPGRHVAVYAEVDDRVRFWTNDVFAADGSWQVAYIPLDELTPAPGHPDLQNARLDRMQIKRLSFGCVSNGLENTLEISDLWIVGAP